MWQQQRRWQRQRQRRSGMPTRVFAEPTLAAQAAAEAATVGQTKAGDYQATNRQKCGWQANANNNRARTTAAAVEAAQQQRSTSQCTRETQIQIKLTKDALPTSLLLLLKWNTLLLATFARIKNVASLVRMLLTSMLPTHLSAALLACMHTRVCVCVYAALRCLCLHMCVHSARV